jgi:hypothetical protein
MTQTLDQLGGKAAGQLIRHEDWNDLVQNVKDINATLAAQIAAAQANIAALTDTVGQLSTSFDAYRQRVEPVIGQFYQVRITASATSFAIGEVAQIEAQVSDPLAGKLQKDGEAGRPWVDFVATWGLFKPAQGFESLAGVGDHSISVRVNEQGVARAMLHADHVTGFSDQDELAVATALATPVAGTAKSAAKFLVEAETPMTAKNAGVFQMMSAEYQRADSPSFRQFTDAYYVKNAPDVAGKVFPPKSFWRDYQATVLAFARSDNDPTTPDKRHGAESILITFRDWITPWIHLEFLDPALMEPEIQDARTRFGAKVTVNYQDTAKFLKNEVDGLVQENGLIGKMRKYQVIDQALDGLTVANAPEFLPGLTQAVQLGVRIQHTMENVQADAVGLPQEKVAFQVFTEAATRADVSVSAVANQIGKLQTDLGAVSTRLTAAESGFGTLKTDLGAAQADLGSLKQNTDAWFKSGGAINTLQSAVADFQNQFSTLNTRFNNVETSVTSVSSRVDLVASEGGDLQRLGNDVQTLKSQVGGLAQLEPTTVKSKLLEFDGIVNRVAALEQRPG